MGIGLPGGLGNPRQNTDLQRDPLLKGRAHMQLEPILGFFEFDHNVRKRGKASLGSLVQLLIA
jgi:hypothetical protein